MSNPLITVNDNGRLICHTEDAVDEWFRSLPTDVKVRLFWMELEAPAVAGALYDELRNGGGFAEANGAATGGLFVLGPTAVVPGAGHGQEVEADGEILDPADRAAQGGRGQSFEAAAARHGQRLPAPVVDMAGPQVVVFDAVGRHHFRVSLFDACRLADAGVIVESTSYSDDQFDGSDVSQYFTVLDASAFRKEMNL